VGPNLTTLSTNILLSVVRWFVPLKLSPNGVSKIIYIVQEYNVSDVYLLKRQVHTKVFQKKFDARWILFYDRFENLLSKRKRLVSLPLLTGRDF
jgi:hypothetical protein